MLKLMGKKIFRILGSKILFILTFIGQSKFAKQSMQTIEHVSDCFHNNHATSNLAIYFHVASQDKLPEA